MSREEAIKEWIMPALKNTWNDKKNAEILKALEQTPMRDATSEERKSTDDYIKSISKPTGVNFWNLEQESCEDAISRQAVLSMQYRIDDSATLSMRDVVNVDDIEDLPHVNPKKKTGYWILLDECSNSGYYCSECLKKVVKEGWSETVKKIKFCPNCGIKILPQPSKEESEVQE